MDLTKAQNARRVALVKGEGLKPVGFWFTLDLGVDQKVLDMA